MCGSEINQNQNQTYWNLFVPIRTFSGSFQFGRSYLILNMFRFTIQLYSWKWGSSLHPQPPPSATSLTVAGPCHSDFELSWSWMYSVQCKQIHLLGAWGVRKSVHYFHWKTDIHASFMFYDGLLSQGGVFVFLIEDCTVPQPSGINLKVCQMNTLDIAETSRKLWKITVSQNIILKVLISH